MEYSNTVKSMSILNALKNHEVGEVIFVEDENKLMIYTEDNTWVELDSSKINVDNSGLKMSEYELCKMSLASMNTLTKEQLVELGKKIDAWDFNEHLDTECYLLYGQEKHIFEVFQPKEGSEYKMLSEALFDNLKRFGDIYRIDFGDSGLEIWIKYQDQEPTFLMLMEWEIINYG